MVNIVGFEVVSTKEIGVRGGGQYEYIVIRNPSTGKEYSLVGNCTYPGCNPPPAEDWTEIVLVK